MGYPGDPIPDVLRLSVVDPLGALQGFNNVNPYYIRPARRIESPTWTCTYCGGKRPAEMFRCEGCGASR